MNPFKSHDLDYRTVASVQEAPEYRDSDQSANDAVPITVDELYPAADEDTSPTSTSLRLLGQVLEEITFSQRAMKDNDLIDADDSLIRAHTRMIEAFCLRAMGDNYRMVLGACRNAIAGRGESVGLTAANLSALTYVLIQLRQMPQVSTEKALDLVEHLERQGLRTTSEEVTILADWLSGESVR